MRSRELGTDAGDSGNIDMGLILVWKERSTGWHFSEVEYAGDCAEQCPARGYWSWTA